MEGIMEHITPQNRYNGMIQKSTALYGLEFNLIKAIVKTESNYNPRALRFEPKYKWLYSVKECASILRIDVFTLEMMQKTSWGLTQIMGAIYFEKIASKPKEMDFASVLLDPEVNISLCCQIVAGIIKKHKTNDVSIIYDLYNSGRAVEGDSNQENVNRFKKNYDEISGKI
jgi:hypothetical protein